MSSVFDLEAKLGLDSSAYDKGLDKAEGKASSFASKAGGFLANGIKTGIAVGTAAIGAATTAIGVLTKASISSYAEYEQMVGGVKKLYGNMGLSVEEYAKQQGKSISEVKGEWKDLEKAQDIVLKNADNAYKTAGMSANQYMETATSFSAALINSLNGDTVAAAKQTDVAMKAISDNWNTFGGDLEMVKNAYQGFAKQNYTMLDNLKLGYGGTKEEMKRLVEDANEYAKSIGQAGNLSMDSFSDIVSAIELIQEKQNIAGTTAREASTTIQGSLGMVKAAWENLTTAFSDPDADIGAKMDQFVEAIVGSTDKAGNHINGFIDNLMPVLTQALSSIGTVISEGLPQLLDAVTGMVDEFLPNIIGSATSLVIQIAEALPGLATSIVESIPEILNQIVSAFGEHSDELMETGKSLLTSIMDGLSNASSMILEVGPEIISGIANGILEALPELLALASELIPKWIETFTSNLTTIVGVGVELITTIADGIVENLPLIAETALSLIDTLMDALTENLPEILEMGIELITNLIDGIVENLPMIIDTAIEIITGLTQTILEHLPEIIEAGIEILTSLIDGLGEAIPQLVAMIPDIISAIWDGIMDVDWFSLGLNILTAVIDGVVSLVSSLGSTLLNIFTTARETIKNVDWLAVGKNVLKGIINGITGALALVISGIGRLVDSIKKELMDSKFLQTGANIIAGIVQGIKNNAQKVITSLTDMAKNALDAVKKFLGIHSPSKKFSDEVGANIAKGTAEGIKKNKKKAVDEAEKMAKDILSKSEKTLNKRKTYQDVTLKYEESFYNKLRNKLKKGTDAQLTAEQRYYDARVKNQQAYVNKTIKNASDAIKKLDKVVKNNYEGLTEAADKWLNNYKVYHDVSLNYEVKYWDALRKKYKKGTQERIDADKKYYEALDKRQAESINKSLANVNKIVANATEAAKQITKTVGKSYDVLTSSAEKWLSNYKVYHDISLKYEMEYWDEIRKQYKEGTQERIEADKKYFEARSDYQNAINTAKKEAKELTAAYAQDYQDIESARDKKIVSLRQKMMEDIEKIDKKLIEELSNVDNTLAENVKKVNEKLEEDIKSLTDAYVDSVKSRKDAIMGMTGLFDRTAFDRTFSKEYLLSALNDQVDALEQWDKELDALQSKLGRDNPLFSALQEMGVSSLYTLKEINTMSNEQLTEYSKLYAKKSQVANARAIQENEGLLEETNRQIASLRTQASADIAEYYRQAEVDRQLLVDEAEKDRAVIRQEAEANIAELKSDAEKQLAELTATYTKDLEKLADTVKTQGKDVGQSMCEGIAEGIKESQAIISMAAQQAAQEALAAARASMASSTLSDEQTTSTQSAMANATASVSKAVTALSSMFGTSTVSNTISSVTKTLGKTVDPAFGAAGYGIVQNLTINSPKALTASEIARQTKNANQQMVLALKGVV